MQSKQERKTSKAEIQESEYSYPYHYLPEELEGIFRQHRYWSWGYRYLGRIRIVLDLLHDLEFTSLLDVGCGDGRFLREISMVYGDRQLAGVDISDNAISLARQLNPQLHFEKRDILTTPLDSRWDAINLAEVLEHLPPDDLPEFIAMLSTLLNPAGHLIITVPHKNEKLVEKHYQHFTQESLRSLLAGHFEECRFIPLDHLSLFIRVLVKLMGGAGNYYIITCKGLNRFMYRYYLENCLHAAEEKNCRKIACLARKKSCQATIVQPEAE